MDPVAPPRVGLAGPSLARVGLGGGLPWAGVGLAGGEPAPFTPPPAGGNYLTVNGGNRLTVNGGNGVTVNA